MTRSVLEKHLDYIQPSKYIVNSTQYSDDYSTPVLTAGESFVLGYTNETEGIYSASKDNPIILFDDFTTSIQWVDFPFKVKSSACKIIVPKIKEDLRFFYYAIKAKKFDHSLHKRYWISEFSKQEYNDFGENNNIIAKELDNINSLINTKKEVVKKLDELIKSQFIDMFDDYENKYDFSSVITDNTKHGYKFDSEYYERTGEIAIVDQSQKYICGYKKLESNKRPWDKECVIFGDHTEIFKYINFPFYLGADGAKILSVSNEWNTVFVYYYLLLNYQKVGNYSRHFKYLKEMKFPKPDMKLQIKFSDLAKQIDKSKFIVQKQINDLQELLDSKMQEYFGEEE